jgi:3-oxoacyl-[acyl-carrier-protein] synthase II
MVSPYLVPRFLTNMPGGWVSMEYDLQGYISACAAACATGAVSVIDGCRAIKNDVADMIVAGAGEASVTPQVVAGFANLKALSRKNETPDKASSPFDRDRDGFVVSEGAAVLILEELESALKRGVDIYAEITGWGITSDASHFTHPSEDGRGMVNAMNLALQTSGLNPESIQYVSAHGTSTRMNDAAETKAIKKVFGEIAPKLAVSSTKSMSGHLLSGAGALEAAVSVKSIKEQVIHGTMNHKNGDDVCDLDYCPEGKRKMCIKNVLSNSFGFGGVNAVIVFSRFNLGKSQLS